MACTAPTSPLVLQRLALRVPAQYRACFRQGLDEVAADH